MRKIAVLFLLLSFIVAACGGSQASKPKADAEKSGEASTAPNSEVAKMILGVWEAEEIGDVLAQYGFSLPAKFTFNEDGTYSWEFTKGGTKMVGTGKYLIVDTASVPYKIDFIQSKAGIVGQELKDAPLESAGIFQFFENGTQMKTIFYNKKFLPRPEEFGDTDTQVYRKVK